MPKKKQLLSVKHKAEKSKSLLQGPESANEYLAVGVDFEEAGEKWRAGDAAKAIRFFVRAVEGYDEGLQKFPQSFDLAYNKARLQYDVVQQPRLLARLPTPLIDLLRLALGSHRYALAIDQDNADLLFNTAQVLTSVAEVTSNGKDAPGENRGEALGLYHEALELFQRCLSVQEFQFDQTEEQAAVSVENASGSSDGDTDMSNGPASDESAQERWASIVEPVTRDTLADTVLAQLETLTAICSLTSSHELAWIEEYSSNTLQNQIARYVTGTKRLHEAASMKAKFKCTLSDAAFRNARLDLKTYEQELATAFDQDLDLSNDPKGLCERAEAQLIFNSSVQGSVRALVQTQSYDSNTLNSLRWKHLASALESLTAASKLSDTQNRPRIHLRRGDCELLRYRLSEAPTKYDVAIRSAITLIRNAQVYYRGAAGLARVEGAVDEEREASVKEAIAARMSGDTGKLTRLVEKERAAVFEVLEDMRDEDLLSDGSIDLIGKSTT